VISTACCPNCTLSFGSPKRRIRAAPGSRGRVRSRATAPPLVSPGQPLPARFRKRQGCSYAASQLGSLVGASGLRPRTCPLSRAPLTAG
jgi:hypothetical protein